MWKPNEKLFICAINRAVKCLTQAVSLAPAVGPTLNARHRVPSLYPDPPHFMTGEEILPKCSYSILFNSALS